MNPLPGWQKFHSDRLASLRKEIETEEKHLNFLSSLSPDRLPVFVRVVSLDDEDAKPILEHMGVGSVDRVFAQAVSLFKEQRPGDYLSDYGVRVSCKFGDDPKTMFIMNLSREETDQLLAAHR